MAIRGVVFDIGGVLENTSPIRIHPKWEQELALDDGEIGRRLGDVWGAGSLGHMSEAEALEQIGKRTGMTVSQVDAFMAGIWRQYLGTLNERLTDYFRGLRPRFRTAILSNSFVGAREREQAAYGFEDMCDLIVYSHEVGLAKPDPAVYKLTCERLGARPEEIAFVDDVLENVVAARRSGMYGVHHISNDQTIRELEGLFETAAR